MWGSYIGAIIYLLFLIIIKELCYDWGCLVFFVFLPSLFIFNDGVLALIGVGITGFLLGWGIHSLVRALR